MLEKRVRAVVRARIGVRDLGGGGRWARCSSTASGLLLGLRRSAARRLVLEYAIRLQGWDRRTMEGRVYAARPEMRAVSDSIPTNPNHIEISEGAACVRGIYYKVNTLHARRLQDLFLCPQQN